MTTKPMRLSRTLKKKLEASLMNLSPRESGRLFLLYCHEADRKRGAYDLSEYPPIQEISQAWEKRTQEAAKKGTEEQNRVTALRNGYAALKMILVETWRWADGDLWRLSYMGADISHRIANLLRVDAISMVADVAASDVLEDLPKPVSHEDYARLVAYEEDEAMTAVQDVGMTLAGCWATDQGHVFLSVPKGFWDAFKSRPDAEEVYRRAIEWLGPDFPTAFKDLFDSKGFYPIEHTEALRRVYVAVEGDRLLNEVFRGDPALMENWAAHGGYATLTDAEYDAKEDEYIDRLAAMVQAGELEGGKVANLLHGTHGGVLLEEGRIPAWAALKECWARWVYGRGYRVHETPTPRPDLIEGFRGVYSMETGKDLTGDELLALAGEYLADCRARPWGKGIAKKVSIEALADTLIAVPHPLTPKDAPDFGRVDYAVFAQHEGGKALYGDWYWGVTWRSLKANAGKLGVDPKEFESGGTWVRENYYPTREPEEKREKTARIVRLLGALRVSHRAFTYGGRDGDAPQHPASVLGVQFTTPLEQAVKDLGDGFGHMATFHRVCEILSQEYFGGLPVLIPSIGQRVERVEAYLGEAEEDLADWLDRLDSPTWNVDTSTLRLVKKPADEDLARLLVHHIVNLAHHIVNAAKPDRPDVEVDFGEDGKEAAR